MRERIIDAALIVMLLAVAGGITWTLLTLNQSEPGSRRVPAQESQANPAREGAGEITPIPLAGIDEAEQTPPPQPEGETAGGPAGGQEPGGALAEEAEDEESAGDAPEPASEQAQVPEPEPLPPGPVQLERIGFSFVTGGAGACGVVLEPWEHVAVSRDILAAHGCGAEVTVVLDEPVAGRSEFRAVIADTMNPVHRRTVNVYVGEDEPALEYGVADGTLRP